MYHSDSASFLSGQGEDLFHISSAYRFNDCDYHTLSSIEQKRTEELVEESVKSFVEQREIEDACPKLFRSEHVRYLRSCLNQLSSGYQTMDASRSWMTYWVLHGLDLLGEPLAEESANNAIEFLRTCQSPTGGFGGGPGQKAHLATTYASIMALCVIGTKKAYDVIDREKLLDYLRRMKNDDGSFKMHDHGETDVRGAYCAAAAAQITKLADAKLFDKTAEWIIGCQTYEGGFAASPGCEAHGGYTFCGIACLTLLGREKLAHEASLLRWLSSRQMRYEGGFNGRTNKLVDGCYSFWQAAAYQILCQRLSYQSEYSLFSCKFDISALFPRALQTTYSSFRNAEIDSMPMFDCKALQNYVLVCCQHTLGGLIDKPGKYVLLGFVRKRAHMLSTFRNRDLYHTCYTLSGLSIAQHFDPSEQAHPTVVGLKSNEVRRIHPIYNITLSKERDATAYFSRFNSSTES
ncbi:protein farnesyltransferase subunit beta [Trichuris trichiura]|uniref:Protein farnesyltransferase subunit beta n=1 Tax=Trichuris trichiura TaxID=36087 RepID=A0A077ZD57_TRITR|nr:protein farnesyltransferase subunit beta [Trichuris trichiura]